MILVVGPNNAGKSSLLHAYDYFVSARRVAQSTDFFNKDSNNQILIEAKLRARADELEDDQTRRWFDNNVATVRKVWNLPGAEAVKYSYDPVAHEWVEGGFGGLDTILQNRCPEPLWIKGFSDPAEIITQLQTLIREAVLEHLSGTTEYAAAESALASLREIIEGDDYVSEISEKISSSVRSFFPDASMRISNPTSDKGMTALFDKQAIVEVSAQESPSLPFHLHGHGLQRQLVLSALQGAAAELSHLKLTKAQRQKSAPDSTKPRILLVEEPELFLSPPAVRVMKRVIKKISELESFQVLAATHSPVMVDLSAERQTVVRVDRKSGKSEYAQIGSHFFDRDDRTTLRAVTMFDTSCSEGVFGDKIIIVEGPTELSVFQIIADRYFKEHDCANLLQTTVMQFGGKSEIPLMQRILRHLKVPYIVVHDIDDELKNVQTWNLNFSIGDEVERARAEGLDANRVAFFKDFESAHRYTVANGKDKAISALRYVISLNLAEQSETVPILYISNAIREGRASEIHLSNDSLRLINSIATAFST
ncbi:MAG: AAA family ATPase [Hyphomonas sp.]